MSGHRATATGRPRRALVPLSMVAFAAGLFLWYAATEWLHVPAFVLPSPVAVARALVAGFAHGPLDPAGLWFHAGVTVWEAVLGFVVGSACGLAVGLALAHWRLLERLAYPYIVAFQALPKVAVAPLLVIWFGFGVEGKIAITAMMTFFPLMVSTVSGYQAVEPERIELARACNATAGQLLWKIVLPSAMPFIFAGLNVASVLAILGAIVGEFVGAQAGLGMLLLQYDQAMEIAPLFAVLVVLGLIGYLFNAAIRTVERRVCFWAQRVSRPERAEILRLCRIVDRYIGAFIGLLGSNSIDPIGDDSGEMDGGEEISGEFVVSGCNASEVLKAAEAALDDVTTFVGPLVEAVPMDAVGLVGNNGLCAALDNFGAEFVAIVALIGEQPAHSRGQGENVRRCRDIGILTGREMESMWSAERIAQRMDFGRAAPTRSADRLRAFPPFPPLAERCALIDVLSSDSTTRSLPRASASNMARHRPRLAQRLKRL